MKQTILSIFIAVFVLSSCCKKNLPQTDKVNRDMNKQSKPFPPTLIYKTKADYFNNVPVILNDDKTMIVSYPDIKDVYYKGELAYPVKLENSYLLDNRGINKNVAFLKYTYEQYSKLDKTPSIDDLFNSIIEKDPLSELFKCECARDTSDINKIILSNTLKNCLRLK